MAERGSAIKDEPVTRKPLPPRDGDTATIETAKPPGLTIVATDAPPGDPARHDPRQRRRAPEQPRRREADGPDPIEAAMARASQAESRAADADRRANEALRQTHTATVQVLAEREQSATALLERAKTAKVAAQQALKTAREANDLDAEQTAFDQISNANADMRDAQRLLDAVEADKQRIADAPRSQGGRQPASEFPPEDQPWIAQHGLFNTDKAYRAEVIGQAIKLQNLGYVAGTSAYYDALTKELDKIYGEGHGVPGTHGTGARPGEDDYEPEPRRRSNGSSTAMPRGESAGGGGSYSGEERVDTPAGPVFISTGPNGQSRVRMATAQADAWRQAAEWVNMTPEAYAEEQIKAGRERAQGFTGGLVEEGEGRRYQ